MRYKHFIWDWNGTLVNDVLLSHELTNKELRRYGHRAISLDHYRTLICHPIKDFYRRLGVLFEDSVYNELSVRFHESYFERICETRLHERAKHVLTILKENGCTHCILSAFPDDLLSWSLTYFDLTAFFTDRSGAPNTFGESKLERGKELVVRSGLPVENILLIGDTVHDYEVAKAVGIDCMLLSHGYQHPFVLSKLDVPVFPDLDKLVEVLKT